jgi:hypothetical protein
VARRVEVIVPAQASMARVWLWPEASARSRSPAPHLALQRVRDLIVNDEGRRTKPRSRQVPGWRLGGSTELAEV